LKIAFSRMIGNHPLPALPAYSIICQYANLLLVGIGCNWKDASSSRCSAARRPPVSLLGLR